MPEGVARRVLALGYRRLINNSFQREKGRKDSRAVFFLLFSSSSSRILLIRAGGEILFVSRNNNKGESFKGILINGEETRCGKYNTEDENERKVERIFVKSMDGGKRVRVELQCRPMRDAIFTIVHGWWLFVERREKSVCAPFFIQQQELLQPSTVNQPSIKTKCSP